MYGMSIYISDCLFDSRSMAKANFRLLSFSFAPRPSVVARALALRRASVGVVVLSEVLELLGVWAFAGRPGAPDVRLDVEVSLWEGAELRAFWVLIAEEALWCDGFSAVTTAGSSWSR